MRVTVEGLKSRDRLGLEELDKLTKEVGFCLFPCRH